MKIAKEANPELVTEPTCMNSWGPYISPWIIKYSDTVWGNSGGDCPLGMGPAPDYRESHTNARQYYILVAQRILAAAERRAVLRHRPLRRERRLPQSRGHGSGARALLPVHLPEPEVS